MSQDLNIVNAAVDAALPTALTELAEMIAIPSVAAKSDSPMEEGAAKVAELLKKRGFEAELIATFGAPPVVFAQNLFAPWV
jgi:acetylornithine deacetylase/succinyl-diaminopimelate desuccinylase-like protein